MVSRDQVRDIVQSFADDTLLRRPLRLSWEEGAEEALMVAPRGDGLSVRCDVGLLSRDISDAWGRLGDLLYGTDEGRFARDHVVNELALLVAEAVAPEGAEEYALVLACMAGAFPRRPRGERALELWTLLVEGSEGLELLPVALVPPFRLDALELPQLWVLTPDRLRRGGPVLLRLGRARERSVPLAVARALEPSRVRFRGLGDPEAAMLGFTDRAELAAYLESAGALYLAAEEVTLCRVGVERPILRGLPLP